MAATVVNAAGLYADATRSNSAAWLSRSIRAAASTRSSRRRGGTWSTGWSIRCRTHRAPASACTWPRRRGASVTLGPTIHYQESKDDYEGGRLPLEAFVEPAQHLLPWVTLADLQPGGSGIRAKLHGPDQKFADFLIQRDHVNPRVIQASGIDSPGLTSSLAIGQRVADLWSRSE